MPGAIKPTGSEQSLNELLAQQLQTYAQQFVPIEQASIERLSQLGGEITRRRASNQAVAGGAIAFQPAVQQTTDALTSQGIDPTSGRFAGAMGEIASARGIGAGQAGVEAALSAEDRFFSEGMNVLRRAGTVRRRGIMGFSRAANFELLSRAAETGQRENVRDLRSQVTRGWYEAAGTVVGTAAGALRNRGYPGGGNTVPGGDNRAVGEIFAPIAGGAGRMRPLTEAELSIGG